MAFIQRNRFKQLLQTLQQADYRCIGPQLRDGAIVYDTLQSVDQLPAGWRDEQAPGRYRLEQHDSPRCFAWANGPQALKPLLFSPREVLWQVQRDATGRLTFAEVAASSERLAVIGVRACDLAALRLQDAHFLKPPYGDPHYRQRRSQLFLIAVNCTQPAATCFCASTGDGPRATDGFDLVLSELDDGYLIDAGTAAGEQLLQKLPVTKATPAQHRQVESEIDAAAQQQSRHLPGQNLQAALFANLDHPRWDDVAQRCLSCGNCTAVCPTCFCYSEQDEPALNGDSSEHYRQWDSCFNQGHSYIHGMVIRPETRTRYRQWLTHKLGSWHEQYGRSGCVGCGRCISWCPAGIDLTDEVAAICQSV